MPKCHNHVNTSKITVMNVPQARLPSLIVNLGLCGLMLTLAARGVCCPSFIGLRGCVLCGPHLTTAAAHSFFGSGAVFSESVLVLERYQEPLSRSNKVLLGNFCCQS